MYKPPLPLSLALAMLGLPAFAAPGAAPDVLSVANVTGSCLVFDVSDCKDGRMGLTASRTSLAHGSVWRGKTPTGCVDLRLFPAVTTSPAAQGGMPIYKGPLGVFAQRLAEEPTRLHKVDERAAVRYRVDGAVAQIEIVEASPRLQHGTAGRCNPSR